MLQLQATDKRYHVRSRPKDPLFVSIQGKYCGNLAYTVDISRNGIGFYLVCEERDLSGEFIIIDLLEKNHTVLRSLPCRVAYSRSTSKLESGRNVSPKRCGLEFVNLSDLEKRMLGLIVKKYTLPE